MPWTPPPAPTSLSQHLALIVESLCGAVAARGAKDRSIPPALIEQLAPGGRLVMPVGDPNVDQQLVLLEKDATGRVGSTRLLPVRFVPLIEPYWNLKKPVFEINTRVLP